MPAPRALNTGVESIERLAELLLVFGDLLSGPLLRRRREPAPLVLFGSDALRILAPQLRHLIRMTLSRRRHAATHGEDQNADDRDRSSMHEEGAAAHSGAPNHGERGR